MDRTNIEAPWVAAALVMVVGMLPAVLNAEEPTVDQQVQMIRSLNCSKQE